jgi:pyruvate/2-oxoglutarate dehydrogenase complex dihydrolipoamide acyltransferase (E2) component
MRATGDDHADVPRDDRLLAALRYASDRDDEPPVALSEQILAAARAAARPSTGKAPRVARWFDVWLSPVGRAALATVTVGVLMGVLWSVQAPSQAPITRSAGVSKAEQARAAADTVAPSPSASTNEPGRAATASAEAAAAIAASPRSPQVARERGADAVASKAAPAMQATDAQATLPASPRPEPARVNAAPVATAKASLPAPESTSNRTAGAAAEAAGSVLADAARPTMPARAALALRAAPAVDDPMNRLAPRLEAGPTDRVRWQHHGRAVAMGEAPQRWWVALRTATRGQWQPAGAPATPSSAPPWLAVTVDGRVEAEWWIEDGALRLREGGVWWRTAITDTQRRAWEDEASRW